MNLKPRLSHDGTCTPTSKGWRLVIAAGDGFHYRLSQLDDQQGIPRKAHPWNPPLTLRLKARVSSTLIPGTWGFGLWNDPFGFSFGPGDGFFRFPALPNAIWFFHASPRNYLSFRDDKPAQGFFAQAFSSPSFHRSLFLAGLALPFSRKTTRRIMSHVIDEDSASINVDTAQWHDYRLEWSPRRSAFWVDETSVVETSVSPHSPLGMVIWIDNQYAAFTPEGKLRWGMEKNTTQEWLEIEGLSIKS